jgi:terminase small subunit-like protein
VTEKRAHTQATVAPVANRMGSGDTIDTRRIGRLTSKQERFCQEIVKGRSQSDAYRMAYKPKRAKQKSIHELASQLMADIKIRSRITEIAAPVIKRIQTSQEEWLARAERFGRADPRKMFDQFGNPLEIKDLGENEAAMIAGYEFTEQYETVEDKDSGTKKAVAVGVTKKIKIGLPFLEGHKYLGKVLGYYAEKHEFTGALTLEELVGVIVVKGSKPDPKVING